MPTPENVFRGYEEVAVERKKSEDAAQRQNITIHSDLMDFEPDGLSFAEPALLGLATDSSNPNLVIGTFDPDLAKWVPLPPSDKGEEGEGIWTWASIQHFSMYAVITVPNGPASPSTQECLEGFSGPNGGPCNACGVGTYKSMPGSTPCLICEAGKFAPNPGLSACLVCPSGASSEAGSELCTDTPSEENGTIADGPEASSGVSVVVGTVLAVAIGSTVMLIFESDALTCHSELA